MKRNNNFGLSTASFSYAVRCVSLLICTALMLGVEGCREDFDEDEAETGRPKDSFSVSIALAGMGTEQTRAAGEDSEDSDGVYGTADENFIDINDLYVMTFSIPAGSSTLTDDSELLEVLWNGKNGGKATETDIYYNGTTAFLNTWLDSKIDAYIPESGKKFCLVAVANFSQYKKTVGGDVPLTKGTKFSVLQQALKYDFSQDPIKDKGIPMFGVKRVNLKGYDKKVHNVANPYILESNGNPTLWMLRAFSKIEVALSEKLLEMEKSLGSITIHSASVNKFGSTFWLIPELSRMSGFADVGVTEGTGGTGQVNKSPSATFTTTKKEQSLAFSLNDKKTSASIYLPEFGIETEKTEISLAIKMGESSENVDFKFDVQRYSDETGSETNNVYWKNLMRNHYYKFIIGIDFKIISVIPQQWNNTYDNEFIFG